LEAVILNKAMSLVVVASALPFRAATVPLSTIAENWPIVVNLLAGSLLGAWFGAGWATRLKSETLYNKTFLLVMAAGSTVGTFIGGLLLGIVPNGFLLPALALILLISAVKVWRHR